MIKSISIIISILLFITGCGSVDEHTQFSDQEVQLNWYKPTPNATWQWQLQGDLNLSYDVDIYDIDLFDTPISTIDTIHASGKKVICYFSAGSYENWRDDNESFPDVVLGEDLDGWDGERWLDIRSSTLEPIMKARLDLAKLKNCDGVEPDNMDGYINNSGFDLTSTDQLNYNKFIANEAHKRGLSVGLKNDLDQISQLEPYFDFAVNEQCNQYNECDKLSQFTTNNKAILNAEYNNSYLDDDNMTILCNYTNSIDLSTLILPLDLNGSFRYDCKDFIYEKFKVGYGSSGSFKFDTDQWLNTTDLMFGNFDGVKDNINDFNETAFNDLSLKLQKSRYMVYWFTKGWQESWFDKDKIQEAINKGKIPVFIYWYFGDELINGFTQEDIDNYLIDINRVQTFLSTIKGEQLFILEPEFNKDTLLNDATNQTNFIDTIKKAIDIIKQPSRKISLCMMDTGSRDLNNTDDSCGYENCALGDNQEWDRVESIYNSLIDDLDFISFQQMVGQFSRDPSDPGTWDDPNPKAYSDDEIGIDYLSTRIDNFASHLKLRYNKPVFLPYITIATATWDDSNGDNDGEIDQDEIDPNGWVTKAQNLYSDLNSSSLFGYAIMELFDNPTHDDGGYQFFIDNEYHLGIVTSDINNSQLTGNIQFKGEIVDKIFK